MNAKAASPLILGLAALLVLTACGRSGAPVRPSVAAAEQARANKEPVPPAPTPNANNPDKRFILDGLLD